MKVVKNNFKSEKKNKWFFSSILVGVVFLAWIITEDVGIPSWLIISTSIIVSFFIFFFGFKKPEIPFYFLVAYMPFNKILSGSFGGFMTALNLTNILIFITVICLLVNRGLGVKNNRSQKLQINEGREEKGEGRKRTIKIRSWMHWLVFLFCLLGVFSVMRGGFYYGSRYLAEFIVPLKRWLTPVFLYFIAFGLIKNEKVLKNTIIIVMIVVAVAGLLAVKEGIDIGDTGSLDSSRVGGLAQQPNMMGAFFVYYMFLYLGFFYYNWTKIKSWSLLIPFLICFRGIQVTFSRGALLAFAFGLTVISFFKSKILFSVMCLGILIMFLIPQFLPGSMRYAIDRTSRDEGMSFEEIASTPIAEKTEVWRGSFEDGLDASSAIRLAIWKGAVEIIKDNPWWGVGYGVFPYVIPYYTSGVGERDAHNTYLIIAAEMGIPVLVVFLLIIVSLFKNTFWLFKRVEDKFIKAVALGMLGGIAGMLVANMFGSRFESEEVSAYFWILAGLIIRAVIMKKRKEIA